MILAQFAQHLDSDLTRVVSRSTQYPFLRLPPK